MTVDRLIITAASSGYEKSLFALIGSLNCNWPEHPPILVYNLGMTSEALSQLNVNGIQCKDIPAFVTHWRQDYTWKFWCFMDVPASTYLWLDAGLCVYRPMPEAFHAAEQLGYFAVSLYNHPVLPSVPEPLLKNLQLDESVVNEMISISSGIHAISKSSDLGASLIRDAFSLSINHENLRATKPCHRHDQALLTLLLYRYFGNLVLADYHIYANHSPGGPGEDSRQKIWAHRRKMLPQDSSYFGSYLSSAGPARIPVDSIHRQRPSLIKRARILVAKLRGRYPGDDFVDMEKYLSHGIKD